MKEPATFWSENEPHRLWETALSQLEVQVTRPNYETWLKDTVGVHFDNGHFIVGAPSDFATEWLSTKLRPLIAKTLSGLARRPVEVSFQVLGSPPDASSSNEALFAAPPTSTPAPFIPKPRLNERYTFDRFIVGHENRLAHAAALAVAETPGSVYNPLFIYGGTGLGKTHLLHAIGHTAWANHCRVLYVTSERFTNDFVAAIQNASTDEFRARYRHVDVLLIDDIQFLAAKERTQEEFFYTFNDLHSASNQIVISSDRSPRLISPLEDRLRSRFEWGLIADIQPPVLETRLAILQAKAAERQVEVAPDVLHFLAERAPTNVRELEGSLNRTVAFARLLRSEITVDLAMEALATVSSRRERTHPSPEAVIKAVADYFDLPPEVLSGQGRPREVAEARHIAMYLLREEARLRITDIGRLLGGRDHSTVIHGLRKIDASLPTNPQLASQIAEIRAVLSG
jgi:chromosomal replication initiator protein